MMADPIIGIIGGTGLGQAFGIERSGDQLHVDTPFGRPSGPITLTAWEQHRVALLSRHGQGHCLDPSAVPYRANIYALKSLGVTHIIASGATGSLQDDIEPGHLVLPDQVIDRTTRRDKTFFDHDIAVHVEFAHPFCDTLREALQRAGDELQLPIHPHGTYVCMEGPQFSTIAESRLHRSWGAHLIGMTCMPEAKLAREAEICYALVALPTDYDCWAAHDPNRSPTALLEQIRGNLAQASDRAIKLIQHMIHHMSAPLDRECRCQRALQLAIWSDHGSLDLTRLQPLKLLLDKYIAFEH